MPSAECPLLAESSHAQPVLCLRPSETAVTHSNLVFRISTCRICPSCRDRSLPVHRLSESLSESYPQRARGNCLHAQKMARLRRNRHVLGDPSRCDAPGVRSLSFQISLVPTSDVGCFADLCNVGSDSHTDRADRIDSKAAEALQQRDNARAGCLELPDTKSFRSESPPHDKARHVAFQSSLRIVA